ncbi:Aminotransferase-like, plant mobile domain [Sesbania bispinosa]|nr:Aminotransferase-like, plant mobile domain [Sesbania bispinosa]
MVKTKGGTDQVSGSQSTDRDAPAPAERDVPEQVVYGGGPQDTSLLRSYESHVAGRLWTGEDQGTLKVVTHGKKLKKPENDYIRDIVDDSSLAPLVKGTHSLVDRSLLSAFTERWHRETSSFHLPVGEMTITLDDVSSLLHIPTEDTRAPYVRLSWLRNVYENHLQQGNLEYATREYLLHLVGFTIFADKSATAVRVIYLELFRVLASVGQIAWGAIALAYSYKQLNEASFRQLAGYTTLLQVWILDHFPHITHIERSLEYVEGLPMCRRLRWFTGTSSARPCTATVWAYTEHPPSPHVQLPMPPITDVHAHFLHYHDHLLDESRRGPLMTYLGECTDGYLDWFRQVSHPYLIPHEDKVHDPLPCRAPTFGTHGTPGGTQHISTISQDDSSHQVLFAGITKRLQGRMM